MSDMFSNATAYERYMGRWSARLAPLFAEFVPIRDGGRVLDVGCGTGSLIQVLTESTRAAEIVGIDLARAFIQYARARFRDSRHEFVLGNAANLPYPDTSFDCSLSHLVFQLIPQVEQAAAEMRRVTRPGGIVAASGWDGMGLEMAAVLWEEARRLDSDAGGGAGKKRSCCGEGQLAALWRATGLVDVKETPLRIRTEFTSFDDYWLPLLGGIGPAGSYVAGLVPRRRDALREALFARLAGGRAGAPITLNALARAVCGTVP